MIVLAVLLLMVGLVAWWFIERDPCPKLILGYRRCNKWAGQPCDHSKEAVAEARHAIDR